MNLYKYNIATDMTTILVPLGRMLISEQRHRRIIQAS